MRYYDYEKAKLFIEQHKEEIKEASLGMHEDWWWTAETIFGDGKFTVELNKDTMLGGINGSRWATPVLQVEYKDGTIKTYHCHDNGEQSGIDENALMFMSGVITSEVNKLRSNIELEEIE